MIINYDILSSFFKFCRILSHYFQTSVKNAIQKSPKSLVGDFKMHQDTLC